MPHLSLLPKKLNTKSQKFFPSKEVYQFNLCKLQKDLIAIQRDVIVSGKKVILVFEGPDAAGKGGVIKRITEALDPRGIQVHSITKPTLEERKELYLERFWVKLPKPGMITIFDRSWYGRVLVERVEKFCSKKEWKRSYDEINNFEKTLKDNGIIILKYFLDITYQEQEVRFLERKNNPFKSWKLTKDDWRNRGNWNLYHAAFKEMLKKTSSTLIPWKVVAADSKWYARTTVISDIVKKLK